ncbi:hypothetical protein [Spirosoma radiotolerans]|uniref:Uncharacterized protein n=1 Tax=Spirosoma radiotolerans TaxID=1379870 RepID=A0A0E3ZY74_9BACT|nr:hypothetical protein [Spirosoma radiotolerans]AKD57285.1 hypothetical protein SD10_22720 [Spirosoma radiotolerans]
MITADLKSILHEQIDRLEDPQDVQDLLLTVSEFVSQRTNIFTETPALLAQLEQALASVQSTKLTTHDQVASEAKQWITQ